MQWKNEMRKNNSDLFLRFQIDLKGVSMLIDLRSKKENELLRVYVKEETAKTLKHTLCSSFVLDVKDMLDLDRCAAVKKDSSIMLGMVYIPRQN